MKQQLEKIKEFFGKMSSGLRKAIIAGCIALLIFAIAIAIALNSGEKRYTTLFSGLSEEEAGEIMARLDEEGVEYEYRARNIMVQEETADRTRASLAMQGYPKSGFTYETFLNNSNMMSTESDKKSLKTWEMQDRLAATIRLFDGVKDAVVQIVPGETQKYVLDNSALTPPTASVMVSMRDGSSPDTALVEGIQRLVAKSVANMDIGDVAVIDGNGIDVSVRSNDKKPQTTNEKTEFEERVQRLVEQNVLNVLEHMYGAGNVRVSAKCTADMQKIVSEQNDYTAPNVENNSGYITHQELYSESEGANGVGGIPGAQTNTNLPQYNTQTGNAQNSANSSSLTDYVLNQRTVQSENDSGVITDLSVAVSINSATLGASREDVIALVGRAAGIAPELQMDRIMVLNSEWQSNPVQDAIASTDPDDTENPYLIYMIIGYGLLVVLLIVLVILLVRRSKKKAREALEAQMAEEEAKAREAEEAEQLEEGEGTEEGEAEGVEEEVYATSEEEERAKTTKANIRQFAEDNPDVLAQLLQNWIRGGEEDD